MSLEFLSPEAQAALDRAKAAVGADHALTPELLMSAAYEVGELQDALPDLQPYLVKLPKRRKRPPAEVDVADTLKPVLQELARDDMVTIDELVGALVRSRPVREYLTAQGMSSKQLATVDNALVPSAPVAPTPTVDADRGWRTSQERQKAMQALASYGRMLTEGEPPYKGIAGMDDLLRRLQRILLQMRSSSVIVIGHPGTGKTALVYEFARRIVTGDPTIHEKLRDRDVFELSPSFLRSGASVVGEYDKRVSALLRVLEANPKIVLFVDEVHSLLQSGMHERTPFTDANEAFKAFLGRGDISLIGATTIAEYRHYIAPDGALARRFGLLKVEPPSPEATLAILKERRRQFEEHYAPLRLPDPVLDRTVDLTEQMLPTQFQPAKSLQLLDEACALSVMRPKPPAELTEEFLREALTDALGHTPVEAQHLTIEDVLATLTAKIVGQDDALRQIATSVVAGLSENWRHRDRPRGNFFFCGPTGVGKTETALTLAEILGGGREALVRVDCNTLQGELGDEGPMLNILLGVPPGYIGYARGQGGVLSKVRDYPECVVLFDEIEKAHPAIGKILLQILDEGRVYDHDDNLLDFRRSFIVFTTNAGVSYAATHPIGFGSPNIAGEAEPVAKIEDVQDELRKRGYGEEFLGRNIDYIVFEALGRDDIETVLRRQLDSLHETAELRGYELTWTDEIVEHLLAQWQPRFGVRFLTTILRHRVVEQLAIAEAQGELKGVVHIHLDKMAKDEGVGALATRSSEGDTLTIYLT